MSSDSGVHFHTVEAEHPELGEYELTFRVFEDARYYLEVSQSAFPTEDHEERLQCVEDAREHLLEDKPDIKVLVDEDEL